MNSTKLPFKKKDRINELKDGAGNNIFRYFPEQMKFVVGSMAMTPKYFKLGDVSCHIVFDMACFMS